MNHIKKLFKENSPYLILLTIAECLLSIICSMSFVYSDSLSYSDSMIFNELGIAKLLQNMYSSTYWALILLLLSFMAIFSICSIVYKKMDYLFLSIACWVVMFILSINLYKPIGDIISNIALFIPILILNIIAYKKQNEKINQSKKKSSKS